MKSATLPTFSVIDQLCFLAPLLMVLTGCYENQSAQYDPLLVSNYRRTENGKTEVHRQYIDATGNVVLQTDFDYSGSFQNGMAFACKASAKAPTENRPDYLLLLDDRHRKCGLIDKKGQLLFPLRPDLQAAYFERGLVIAMVREEWGLLNRQGETILDFEYDLLIVDDEYIRYRQDGYYGLLDRSGSKLTDAKYLTLSPFADGFALFTNEKGQVGYVTENGQETLVHEEVESVLQGSMKEGLQRFARIKVSPAVEGHFRHHHGLKDLYPIYSTYTEGKVGFLDSRARIVIQQEFDRAGDFHEGRAAVVVGGKLGFINTAGDLVLEAEYQVGDLWNAEFSEGLAPVLTDAGFFHYIDTEGSAEIRFVQIGSRDWIRGPLHALDRLNPHWATAWGNKHGYFRLNHFARPFTNGLASIRVSGPMYGPRFIGLMNHQGKLVYVNRSDSVTGKDMRLPEGTYGQDQVPEVFR
ncbi:MAG: WG repeat-containing protein [Leptospiraceae bacterium]|nr:WG repeat-containing protein [Leptospiraceae bacterium]